MATLGYSQIKWHKLPKPFAILIACTTLGIVGFTIVDAVKTNIRAFQIEQENLVCKEESQIVAHNPTKVLTFLNLSNYIYTQNNGYPDMYFFERVNITPKHYHKWIVNQLGIFGKRKLIGLRSMNHY